MVITTPKDKSAEHKSWHTFRRGGCLYCGWHCDDCPIGIATCKCTPEEKQKKAEQFADHFLRKESLGITDYWRE